MTDCNVCAFLKAQSEMLGLPAYDFGPYCEHDASRLTPGYEVRVKGDYASFEYSYVAPRKWETPPNKMVIAFGFPTAGDAEKWRSKWCRHGHVAKGAPDGRQSL